MTTLTANTQAILLLTARLPEDGLYHVPIVVTGFEPVDLLQGTLMTVRQLEQGRAEVENQYARAIVRDGNTAARKMISRVFATGDRGWRGLAGG